MGTRKEGEISSTTARFRDHGFITAEESKTFPGMADYSVHEPKEEQNNKGIIFDSKKESGPRSSKLASKEPRSITSRRRR